MSGTLPSLPTNLGGSHASSRLPTTHRCCRHRLCCAALCAEKNASELELKAERVIVFKDGNALIIKRGVATTDKADEVFT